MQHVRYESALHKLQHEHQSGSHVATNSTAHYNMVCSATNGGEGAHDANQILPQHATAQLQHD